MTRSSSFSSRWDAVIALVEGLYLAVALQLYWTCHHAYMGIND